MDERAISCFDEALVDVGLTDEPLRSVLHDYFAWATTKSMAEFHESADDVPSGLPIPRWSWEGLDFGPVTVAVRMGGPATKRRTRDVSELRMR